MGIRRLAVFAIGIMVGIPPILAFSADSPVGLPNVGRAVWFGQGAREGGPITEGFQVFIEAQRDAFVEGDPISVVFRVKNIDVPIAEFGWSPFYDTAFKVDVTTPSGVPMPERELVPRGYSGASGSVPLKAGEGHAEVGDINDHYSLSPGTYILRARLWINNPGGKLEWAPSNPLQITVVAPAEQPPAIAGLHLSFRNKPREYPLNMRVHETIRLANSSGQQIPVVWDRGKTGFHGLTLEVKTLSGVPVPRKTDADGREIPFEEDSRNPNDSPTFFDGPIEAGQTLERTIDLLNYYDLAIGTAYTVRARLALITPTGPVELVSAPDTIVLANQFP
jgi:hypothetical protein